MLSKRYASDGDPILKLNQLQIDTKNSVDKKVKQGKYTFEKISCCICENADFETLSEKDRYGLYVPVVICTHCGLVQTNPRMTQEAYNEFYEAEQKKLYVGQNVPDKLYFEKQYVRGGEQYNYLSGNLGKQLTDLHIFEIGCSAGGILEYFRKKGNHVRGCDLNSEYVLFGKEKYNLDLISGTIDDMEINPKPDIILLSHTLEHILNPVEFLSSIGSIMHDDTVLYIELPGIRNLMRSYEHDFLRYVQNAHVYHFTLTTLQNLLEKVGCELVSGDETIRSIFKKSPSPKRIPRLQNDYTETMKFLKRLEFLHIFYGPYRNAQKSMISASSRTLKKMGLYKVVSKIYRRVFLRRQ